MRSSISSFEAAQSDLSAEATKKTVGLCPFTILILGTIAGMLVLAELVTDIGFDTVSKVQTRELAMRRELEKVHDGVTTVTPHVAVLGNSLMLSGVDESLLAKTLTPKVTPVSYFVLATEYYDWYYGLKRLFSEGVRPRYLVLGLSPNQLVSPNIRGEYSANYLFQGSDLQEVINKTRMDATSASGFILAHFSKFYATRIERRGFILARMLPSVAGLFYGGGISVSRAPDIDENRIAAVAAERLVTLDQLCRANGAQFALVVPPTYQKGSEVVARAGKEHGVKVFAPLSSAMLDADKYARDGFHLNEVGAHVFTTHLAHTVLAWLSE